MNSILIALVLAAVVAMVHFAYVDFRFRHREGVAWFWLGTPAPAILMVSRICVVIAMIAALATIFTGANKTTAFVIGGALLTHILTLIVLERRESR